jgi:Protein of unknown function (DUF2510)
VTELSELPPPRKGARAGYYPDPLGGRYARWWDGQAWTLTVGPLTPQEAPRNKALAPPKKTCPHCGVESETFEGNCPNCGRSYSRTSPWTIAAVIAGAVVLTVGGCGGCIALIASESDEHSISSREFAQVTPGTSQAAIESDFGEPLAEEESVDETCLYYQADDFFSDREYAFCFRGEILVRKFDYNFD